MKRIIGGKRYDTDNAEWLASWQNMSDRGNYRFESFTVWRTAKGNHFLEYWGGAMSSYGRKEGNEYHGGEGIQPLTPEEAVEYLERCGPDGASAIEKYFPVEDA